MTSIKFTVNKNIDKQVDFAIQKALEVVCIDVEAKAKHNCPVGVGTEQPGRLRASITRKVEERKGIVYTDVYYGKYVEFGTRFQKAQYFMRRALFENYKGLINTFQKVMKGLL